ncbi:MAG TPA: POTRA domain-containing protein [Thermoanaerobaculia bacterium]|jgi:outer membrane protein assembly factor BamA|nr:POTRA domain-containing protein [Thermoanaerobaculia bacterium]
MSRTLGLVLCLFLSGAATLPADTPDTTATDSASLEGAIVGEIRVINTSIFDPAKPGEDNRLFRLADRLHRTTRPEVITRQLTLQPGDRFTHAALEESERILRANDYLYDAHIRVIPSGDGMVDLEVETRDVWTLQGGISFNRAGEANTGSAHLEDNNFLGTGKEVTLLRVNDVDRTSNVVRFRDPNLLGGRTRMTLSYADNSDGGRKLFEIDRPFYSLDARWATGLQSMLDNRVEPFYELGRITQRYRHEQDFAEVYTGLSPGLADGSTHRWRLGYTYDRQRFEPYGSLDSTDIIPADRKLSYPWLGFEYVQDGFVTEHGLDRLQRAEDLNLGKQLHARFGWSTPTLGGDVTRLIFETGATAGWRPGPRQLFLASVEGSTRWRNQQTENLLAGGTLRYYVRDFGNNVFYAAAEGEFGQRLDAENQILLGGDNGLRGYPLRYQSGDRRILFTLEQRFFSDREYFHLLHVGAAVFFDAGRAWYDTFPDPYFFPTERPLLKDAGIGLRLGSSRSSRAAMVHLDLAFPLNGDSSIKRVQWLVTTNETF